MARIRTIKPEFWTDENILECSTNARLLFLGLLNFADDEGNIEGGCKSIKAKVFPADNIKIMHLLVELRDSGLIVAYEVDGKSYLHIQGFKKHQKIDKPGKPRCPIYEHSTTIPRTFNEPSSQEGKGSSKGKELKPIEHPKADAPITQRMEFEKLWEQYPEKKGKEKAWLKYKAQVQSLVSIVQIERALGNYIADVKHIRANGQPDLQWQYGSTWFNSNWKDYVDYQPPKVKAPPPKNEEWKKQFEGEAEPPEKIKALLTDFNNEFGKEVG